MTQILHAIVAAHALAAASGCAALSAFAAWRRPPLGAAGSKSLSSHRVGAAMLSIMLALVAGIALDLHHPLAPWTAALVASGWFRFTPRNAASLALIVVGWPYVYVDGKHNPQDEPPGDVSMEQWAELSENPVLMYTPHSAPMQMAFYAGDRFPAEYRGDAFVTMCGSWNRKPPSGYEVVRVDLDDQGTPRKIEPFLTGFLVDQGDGKWGQFARLAGCAMLTDGSLVVSDDKGGVIYRITYDDAAAGQNR